MLVLIKFKTIKNYYRHIIFCLLYLLCFSKNTHAQEKTKFEDSLLSLINSTNSIKLKTSLYKKLHLKFGVSNKSKSLFYIQKRLETAQKLGDEVLITDANNFLGWYLTNTIEKPNQAKPYLERALQLATKLNDSTRIGRSLTFLGFMYQSKSYYNIAMDHYFKSIPYKEAGNNIRELSFSYNLIGKIYEFQENYSKSLEYHFIALDLRKKHVDSLQVAHSLKNIGWIYLKDKQYLKSIEAFNHCKVLSEKYNHRRRLSFANNGLGYNYLALGKLDSALAYFNNAMLFNKELNLSFNQSQSLIGLSNIYYKKQDYDKAKQHAEEAIVAIDSNRYYDQLKDAYQILYRISEEKKQNSEALEHYKNYRTITDSIVSQETKTQIAEMELLFETKKKEKQLATIKAENIENAQLLVKEKNNTIILIVSLIALGSILLITLYYYKKNNHQKKHLKKNISDKNVLLKETHHRVKNSFQIVSSLLYLQSTTVKSKEASEALKEAQNRVNSMVLLHQKLYKKDHVSAINCNEYITALIDNIVASYSIPHIDIELNIAPLIVGIETITSLGLIINELVTNSIKHAFNNSIDSKVIMISLLNINSAYELQISDNGIGMDSSINIENSFGLILVTDLVEKVNGKLIFETLNQSKPYGTKTTVQIKTLV